MSGLLLQLADWQKVEVHQRADLASMALDVQVEAIRLAIETTLAAAGP